MTRQRWVVVVGFVVPVVLLVFLGTYWVSGLRVGYKPLPTP